MTESAAPAAPTPSDDASRRRALLAFVLPLAVYMLLQALEPSPLTPAQLTGDEEAPAVATLPGEQTIDETAIEGEDYSEESSSTSDRFGIAVPRKYYPAIYTVKVVVTLGVLLWLLPVYLQWPLKVSPLAVGVGVVGGGLWIACCWINLEGHLVTWLGEEHTLVSWLGLGERPGYNPLATLGPTAIGYAFLAVRFFGLVLLVPVIEEAFLRAFLMRFVMHDNWTDIPFGVVNRTAVAAGVLVPVLYHPEKLAALVWFSLVTWLMVRTKNYWDCVAAHAITNLILGVVVVTTGWWALW